MKVGELLQHLSKLDPSLEVLCFTEHESLVPEGLGLRLLSIESVTTTDGERIHLPDGTPYLQFRKSSLSKTLAFLEVGPDF
jgi:hypothetical protein